MSEYRTHLIESVRGAATALGALAATLDGKAEQDVAGNGHVASADEATGPLREPPTAPAPAPAAPRRWRLLSADGDNDTPHVTDSERDAWGLAWEWVAADNATGNRRCYTITAVVEASALEAAETARDVATEIAAQYGAERDEAWAQCRAVQQSLDAERAGRVVTREQLEQAARTFLRELYRSRPGHPWSEGQVTPPDAMALALQSIGLQVEGGEA